jgi:hypothetical protein
VATKPRIEQPRELTAREKAIEFAKHNIPKPKPRQGQVNVMASDGGLNMIHEEEFDEMGNTIGMRDTVIPSKAA